MHKLLMGFLGLLLVGAGCVPVANAPVDGKWQLAFDLPTDWVMVVPYAANTQKPLEQDVTRNMSEVWLQKGQEKICFSSGGPCPEGYVVNGEQIRITKLDPRRVLPTNRVGLENGFSRVQLCEDGGECTISGQGNYEYYLEGEGINYKFIYYGATNVIEPIIESAKRVTHFTDVPTIEVQTE